MVRKLPGFGEERFQGLMTEVTQGVNSRTYGATLAIGPMTIYIILANQKEPLYAITYRFIVGFQSMGHKLVLKFVNSKTSKIISIEFKLREIDTVLMLLNYNIKIIRDLMLAKQREQRKEQEDTIKRLRGGFVDENGIVRQAMLDFYVSSDLEKRVNLPKVWLETIRTGKEVADTLVPIMKLDPKIEYAILLWILKESYKWVLNDQTLASANPYRGTILFVIEAFPKIRIHFSMGKTKMMILPIVKKVEELLPIVAKGNGLKHSLGFTLYLPVEGQPSKPLDTSISIPEQATRYSELEFRRRFFIITKHDLEDPTSIYQAFCDVRELILSGKVAISQDDALELMYYALIADGPAVLTPTTIPNENSFPAYLPVNMKVNYKTGKNKINEFLNTIPVEGKINAMIKYIQKARSLPQFGCEEFQVILVEEKNGHTTRTNVILFCGPYKVFVMDENRKNVLVNVPYQKFIKLETFGIELSIKYCTEEFTAGYCNIESERAEEIASLILSYLNLHRQILMQKIQDIDENPGAHGVEMITVFCQDFDNAQRHLYDKRDTGKEVIRKACQFLGLDPTGQYSALLRISDDDFRWVTDDVVLGALNPFDGVTIHLYYTYMPVQIHTDTFDRQMLINIEKTVEQLIDEIAFKMYVDFPLGYTLYARDEEGEFALDLARTVPEQVLDFDKMTFRRRVFLFTKEDITSPYTSLQIFPDVKFWLPGLEEHDMIQKSRSSAEMYSVLEKNQNNAMPIYVERQLDHPSPNIYQISKDLTPVELAKVGLYDLTIQHKKAYILMVANQRKKFEKDNDYKFIESDQTLASVSPVNEAHLFVVEYTPVVQVITTIHRVAELELEIKVDIFTQCQRLANYFNLGSHLGYTLYEVLRGERRPLDFKYNILLTTPNYVEVLLKRRFLLFSMNLLRNYQTLLNGYKDVKQMALSGIMTMTEEQAFELAILSLYAESSQQSEVSIQANKMTIEELTQLLPKNITVHDDTLRRFKAEANLIVPMLPINSMIRYIILANNLTGYGSETYKCYYTDVINVDKKARKECLISLSPYSITIQNANKQKQYSLIMWRKINSFNRHEDTVEITYNDENGIYCHIEVESEEHSREIFSFINDLIELFNIEEFKDFPNFLDIQLDDINGGFDEVLDLLDRDAFNLRDDDEIDSRVDDMLLRSGDLADDDLYNYGNGNDQDKDGLNWRLFGDGLQLQRVDNLLDGFLENLNILDGGLNDKDPNDLYRQLDFMYNQLKNLLDECDDETKQYFLPLLDSLNSLRKKVQEIALADMDITPYISEIKSQMDELKKKVNDAKAHITKKVNELKLNLADSFVNDRLLKLATSREDQCLANALLNISDLQEKLISSLQQNYPMYAKYIEDANSIIRSLGLSSSTLTQIASNLLKSNGNPEMIRKHLIPQLNDILKQSTTIGSMLAKAKEKGVNLPELEKLYNDLVNSLEKLLKSDVLNNYKQDRRTQFYQYYPGDHRPIQTILPTLIDNSKFLTQFVDSSTLSSNKVLQNLFRTKAKQLEKDTEAIQITYENLNIDALNDESRTKALEALQNTMQTYELVIAQMNKVKCNPIDLQRFTQTIPYLTRVAYSLSSINVTPENVQRISDDLTTIWNRYASLPPEIVLKLTDSQRTSFGATLNKIKDLNNMIDKIMPKFKENPTSGQCIYRAQQVVLRIHDILPEINGLLNDLHKLTLDPTYPVLYERLITNVKSTLCESPISEEFSHLDHLKKFQRLQVDTARVLNLLAINSENPYIKANNELHEKLEFQGVQLRNNYLTQVETRGELHERPFANDIIANATSVISKLKQIVERIQPASRKVSDLTSNLQLEQMTNHLLTSAIDALQSIQKAKCQPFRKLPTKNMVDSLLKSLLDFQSSLNELNKSPAVQNNEGIKNIFNKSIQDNENIIKHLRALSNKPDMSLYKFATKLQKELGIMIPTLPQINDFRNNKVHQDHLSALSDSLTKILEEVKPTLEDCKDLIKNYLPILNECLTSFKNHSNNPKVKQNQIAYNALQDWIEFGTTSYQELQDHSKDPKYNIHVANDDKNIILKLLEKYSQIPMDLRKSLIPKEIEDLAKLLGKHAEAALATINCIRQLPGLERPKSDPTKFTKVELSEELSSSVPKLGAQIESLRQFYKELIEANTLLDRPNALKLAKDIEQQLGAIKSSSFKPDFNEDELKKILSELKEKMQSIISSSELISPIVHDPYIGRNTRIVNDNINTILHILENPHLDKVKAKEFINAVLPLLKKIQPQSRQFLQRDDVVSNNTLYEYSKSFDTTVDRAIAIIPEAQLRKLQMTLDELYQATSLLLPYLQENPSHEAYLVDLNKLFDLLSEYTSLQKVQIKYSDAIVLKNPILSDKAIKELADQTFAALESKNNEVEPDLFENLSDNLGFILDHQDQVPIYISTAAGLIMPIMPRHELIRLSDSLRTVISCSSTVLANDLYEKLVVKTSVRTALQLIQLEKSLEFLEQRIEQYSNMFDDETKFYLTKLQNAIKHSDTTLILQCQSLPTAVFNFQPMHNIDDSLQLLLSKVTLIPTLKPIVQPLQDCGKEFSDWVFQSDLSMMAYFQSHLDQITVISEDLLTNDKTHKLPPQLSIFIRKAVSNLKFKERGFRYDMPTISDLAKLTINYLTDIYPQITKVVPDSDNKKLLNEHVKALERIRPIIKNWQNPVLNLTNQGLRSNVISSLCTSIKSTNHINTIINTNPNDIQVEFALGSAKISSLLLNLINAIEKKVPVKEVYDKSSKANDMVKEIYETNDITKIQININELNKMLSESQLLMEKSIPIDYNSIEDDIILDLDSFLNMISDPEALSLVKEAAKILEKLLASIPKLSNEQRSSDNNKFNPKLEIKLSNGKPYQFSLHSIALNSISQKSSDPMMSIDPNQLNDLLSKLGQLISNVEEVTSDKQNVTLSQVERTMLSQRISQLQQQQISEFPDVIKSISSLNSKILPITNITSDQANSSIHSIQQQFEALSSSSELHKLQSRLTPDQILPQQLLLTHNLSQAIERNVDLSIQSHVEQTNEIHNQLFKTILEKLQTNGMPKVSIKTDDLNASLQRGYSQLSLINQLITIQQQLSVNIPDLFKFVQSPEGLQLLSSPITPHQLLEQQQNILKQINLVSSPELLNAFQKNLLPEQIIIQQRILQHSLKLLIGDYGKYIMTSEAGIDDVSQTAIFASLNLLQQEIIKENPEISKLNYYVNPSDILEAQQFAYDLLSRLTLMQKISDIQQKQLISNNNSSQVTTKLNQPMNAESLKASQVSTHMNSLITQFMDPSKVSKSLSSNDLLEQQQILSVIKGILSNPELLYKYCGGLQRTVELNNSMNELFTELQTQQNSLLRNSTKSLDGIKPLTDSQVINSYEKSNSKLLNLNRIEQIKNLINTFDTINPTLCQQVLSAKPSFTSDQLEITRSLLERLIDLSSTNISSTTELISNLTKEEQQRIYSLLITETSKLTKFDPYMNELLQKESRVFDMAALIQRQPGIGIVSVSTKDLPQIEKLDQIEKKIKELQESIVIKGVQSNLIKLMEARNDLSPILSSINDSDVENALKEIKPNDIPKLSSSLIEQVKVINDNSKLNNILEHTKKDQLIVEQLMLQQMTTNNSKESKDAQLKGITLSNVTSNLQTTIVKSTEQLIEDQKPQLTSSLQLLTPLKPLSQTKVKAASKLVDEQFTRICVSEKLEEVKLKQLKGIKGIDEFVHNTSSYESAISDPFTQVEVIDYQDMLKSLITINTSVEDVIHTYSKQTKETNARGLTILTNLIDTITPTNVNIVESLEKDDITELSSFFDKSINYDDILIGPIMDVKIPSERQNASRIASAYQGFITIVPTMYSIPPEEVKSILVTENTEALNIITSIYDSKSTSYSNDLRKLVEIAPQLVASYARYSSTLKPQVKSQLKLNPLNILSSIETLQNTSCMKTTPETSSNFRKTLANLLSMFQNIDSAIVERKDEDPVAHCINCLASMAKAIQNQDIDLLNKEIIHYKGLDIYSLSFGTNNSYLKSIEPKIQKIIPLVEKSYAIHGKLSTELQTAMTDLRKDLITIINKETKNPYELIEKIKTAPEVQKVISTSIQGISHSTKKLIDSVQNRNKVEKTNSIASIIELISNSIAAIFQGLNITSCQNQSIYNDCVRIFDSSMISIRSMLDYLKTSAVSSTSIRRSTRSFNRMFDSMMDIMEDTKTPSYTTKPTTPINTSKLEFIHIQSDFIKLLSSTITARAVSKIPETFDIFFTSQIQKLDKFMKDLENKSQTLLKLNTDKNAANDFNELFNNIKSQYGQFKSKAKNPTINMKDSALFDLTFDFINLSDSFYNLTLIINKLTDVVPIVPDLESAQKLRKRYEIPSVPNDTIGLKIPEAIKKLKDYINVYQQKIKSFFALFPNSKNGQYADSMNQVYDAIDNVILQTLRVSAISMNLEFQSGLATTSNTIAVNFDLLLKELRSKFMLSGDWEGQSPKYRDNIQNALNETEKIVQNVLTIAEQEAKVQNAKIAKFTKVLNPLIEVKSSMESLLNTKIKKLKSSICREYATNMLGIGMTLCDSVNHVVLYTKDHNSNQQSIDSYLSMTENVTNQMKLLIDVSNQITDEKKIEEPETLIIERMKAVTKIGEQFAKPHQNESQEAKALRENVVMICKNANALEKSAENALNNKREQKRRREEAREKGVITFRAGSSKDSLLKRLELESRVIRARIILEKSEKRLAELG
ncbi:uncharacterized protein GO595_010015 [Histomonas meleagridis]|uniref:uncharacterized protein n=1 Tax=Histomonas meleagridis TaxID=135588 RepID=UPI00355A66F8|nr:hypothetical protein GO595_010015 [Histomonas meleagridis]